MSTTVITWLDVIDSPWLGIHPTRIGNIPAGLGTPDKYILIAEDDHPIFRVDAYASSEESFTFHDAVIWHGFLVVGWGDCAYLIDISSGAVTKHALGNYFGHVYANNEYLLVASGDRLWSIHRDGSVQWKSDVLGIDGVVVGDVSDGIISGDGEWDPPGGWHPFRVYLDSGRNAE
ncbi:MAG: hypothetical protein ACYC0X_29455 [Pirellulaceae bacterium]